MKVARKILGSLLISYPLVMFTLAAHTKWQPVSLSAATASGYAAFCIGVFLISPLLDD